MNLYENLFYACITVAVLIVIFIVLYLWLKRVSNRVKKSNESNKASEQQVRQCVKDLVGVFSSNCYTEEYSKRLQTYNEYGNAIQQRLFYIKESDSYKILYYIAEYSLGWENYRLFFINKTINREYDINSVSTYLKISRGGILNIGEWNCLKLTKVEKEWVCRELNLYGERLNHHEDDDCDKVTGFLNENV